MPMQMKKAFASDILGKAEYAIIIMITERANNAMSVEALILSIYIFFNCRYHPRRDEGLLCIKCTLLSLLCLSVSFGRDSISFRQLLLDMPLGRQT